MDGLSGWYFLAFPDNAAAAELAGSVCGPDHQVINHSSGRPWLLHTYPPSQFVVNPAGDTRIATVGFSSFDAGALQRAADSLTDVGDLNGMSHRTSGGCGLVASVSGVIRAQGTATGVRRVFHALVAGQRLVGDRADVLASLAGASMDDVTLAFRLLRKAPYPLGEQPLWHGVTLVPPDHYVAVRQDGIRYHERLWWRRPEPVLSRAEGAMALRQALQDAVDARTRQGHRAGHIVHTDLSGGFDSTPITYFASRGPAGVIVSTAYNSYPGGGEDLIWARRAMKAIPGITEHQLSTDDMPRFYGGLLDVTARMDDATDAYRAAPRLSYMIDQAIRRGAGLYLNGQGGDELLEGHLKWEHTLARQRPVLALRRLRQHQLLNQLPFAATFGRLTDTRTYQQWLADVLAEATERDDFAKPSFTMDWDHRLVWPKWLSAEVKAAMIARIKALCMDVVPLGPTIAAHHELSVVLQGAAITRGTTQLGATKGIAYEAPLSDDRVTEAVLSVRREERTEPKRFKPLMCEAMRGLLPDDHLTRSTKTGGSGQSAHGLQHHEQDLVALCEDSTLVERGIVDLTALRRHAFPRHRWIPVRDLDTTINAAVFLRNQRSTTLTPHREER